MNSNAELKYGMMDGSPLTFLMTVNRVEEPAEILIPAKQLKTLMGSDRPESWDDQVRLILAREAGYRAQFDDGKERNWNCVVQYQIGGVWVSEPCCVGPAKLEAARICIRNWLAARVQQAGWIDSYRISKLIPSIPSSLLVSAVTPRLNAKLVRKEHGKAPWEHMCPFLPWQHHLWRDHANDSAKDCGMAVCFTLLVWGHGFDKRKEVCGRYDFDIGGAK